MKRKDLIRIKNMIERDSYNVNDNFTKILMCDISKVLSEYFEYSIKPTFEFKKKGDLTNINVTIKVDSVKNFESLPKN